MSKDNKLQEILNQFLDEDLALKSSEKIQIELTKCLIKLDKTDQRLDKHISSSELKKLKDQITQINTELVKLSFFLGDRDSLRQEEIAELKAAGDKGSEIMMDLLVSSLGKKPSKKKEKDYKEQDKKLRRKKQQIAFRLKRIEKSTPSGKKLNAEDIANLSREKEHLVDEIEKLLNNPDYFYGVTTKLQNYASENRREKATKMIEKLSRLVGELHAIKSIKIICALLFGETVNPQEILIHIQKSKNPVFLQNLLILADQMKESFDSGNDVIFDESIGLILSKKDTFKSDLLKKSLSFFNSSLFTSSPKFHTILIFNASAPPLLAKKLIPVDNKILNKAVISAEGNYHSTSILDVFAEVVRLETNEDIIKTILEHVSSNPIKKYRFYKIAAWKDGLSDELKKFIRDKNVLDVSDIR